MNIVEETLMSRLDHGRNDQPAASAGYAPMPEFPTDAQLADACLWHRHDFGLLSKEHKDREIFAMRERWRAIWKAVNTPGRGAEFL